MGEVVPLPLGKVALKKMSVKKLLSELQDMEFEGVIVLGYTADGYEHFASTYEDGGTALWLCRRFEKQLLEEVDEYY